MRSLGATVHITPSFSRASVECLETARAPARGLGLIQDLVEMRLYDLSQFGKMGMIALAVEQSPAKFFLQQPDRARQRRLRDVAAARGPSKVELLAERAEIDYLLHFHSGNSVDRLAELAKVEHH